MAGVIRRSRGKRSFQSFKDVSGNDIGNVADDGRLKDIEERGKENLVDKAEDKVKGIGNKKSVKRVLPSVDGDPIDVGKTDRSYYDDEDEDDADLHTPKKRKSSSNWTVLASSEPANSPSPANTPSLPQRHPQRLAAANARRRPSSTQKRGTPSPSNSAATKRRRQQLQQQKAQQVAGQTEQKQQLNNLRPARFHEASMHDRPSEKPPSMFTRMPANGSGWSMMDLTTDRLMEQYHHHNRIGGAGNALGHGNGSGQVFTHAYGLGGEIPKGGETIGTITATSAAANDSSANSSAAESTKQSGLFRFGKTFASTFNPVQIWQRVATNWKEAKEEVFQEEREAQRAKMEERRIKAEREYAALKKDNRLASLGTHALPVNAKVYAPGYTNGGNFSSIDLGGSHSQDQRRSSLGSARTKHHSAGSVVQSNGLTMHAIPPFAAKGNPPSDQQSTQTKKSAFHIRTPSFTDLKRIRSDVHLKAKHSTSELVSPNKHIVPTIEGDLGNPVIRKTQSKKDLIKQLKLTKRVSNLESKLAEARRELNQVLAEEEKGNNPTARDVFDLTSPVKATTTSASASLLSSGAKPFIASQNTMSPPKKLFVPGALPTLPSERLLNPEQLDICASDNKDSDDTIEMSSSPEKPSSLPRSSLVEGSEAGNKLENAAVPRSQSNAKGASENEVLSPDIWIEETKAPNVLRKQRSKTGINRNRKTSDEIIIQQGLARGSDEDEEIEYTSPRSPRKRAASANLRESSLETVTPGTQRLLKKPSDLVRSSPRKLLKPIPERSSNELPVTKSPKLRPSTSTLFDGSIVRSTDENEPWETENPAEAVFSDSDATATTEAVNKIKAAAGAASKSKTIALANVPAKPTAVATPAHPSFLMHSPSLSPPQKRSFSSLSASNSPMKSSPKKLSKRAPAVPKVPTVLRESAAVGGIGVEEVVVRQGSEQKEHWEWPEDVF